MESILKNAIPFSTSLELTRRCNLRCKHCYIIKKKKGELTTEEWKRIMDELQKMGTIILTITGGEPLIRKDFVELAEYASTNFALRIFTNAILINESIAERLSEMNVIEVETSIYGSKAFHDRFTGKKGAWEKTLKGIELLQQYGIKVNIKMSVMNNNINEMERVKEIAYQFHSFIGFDPVIVPREDGKHTPSCLRVKNIRKVVKKIKTLSQTGRKDGGFEKHPSKYLCGAGVTTIAIDSTGNVFPCVGWRITCGNIRKETLRNIFYGKEMEKVREVNRSFKNKCDGCEIKNFCEFCIGLSWVENEHKVEPVEFLCKLASEKKKIFLEEKSDSCDKI